MVRPNINKLKEIISNDSEIARYHSNLEKKCLYDLEKENTEKSNKDQKFSTEIKNYLTIVSRGIEELEKGIHSNRRTTFRYGTEKYDLSVKGQKEIYAVLKEDLVQRLTSLLSSFHSLEERAQQKIQLTLYCGAASPSGNNYELSNEPIFLVPRDDATVIFINAKRRKNKKETQWITDIVGDYPFAELEEKKTLEFRNNYFNYVYYIDGAEEYPIEETVLPVIEKKYDRLFGG